MLQESYFPNSFCLICFSLSSFFGLYIYIYAIRYIYICMCAYKHFDLNFYFHYENLCPLVYLSLQAILCFFYFFFYLFNASFIISTATLDADVYVLAASIWLSCILGALQLYLQRFGADLKTMHRLYGCAR